MDKNARVLISGAGISGLTAAIWLAEAGFRPLVVEKADTPRVGGFLVALSHQAYFFAQEMNLLDALKPYDLRIDGSSYHDRTGRELLNLDNSALFSGLGIVQVSRDDLARVLHARARDLVEIRFDDNIAEITQTDEKADVKFASGSTGEFDVVIGADGLHSTVREKTFSKTEYHRHYLDLCVAAFKLPNVIGLDAKFETHMERNRYMAVHSTVTDDIGAVFVWDQPGARSVPPGPDRGRYLKAAFHNTSPMIERILEHCPMDQSFYMDALCQIDMPVWHRNRSVLVGDAAWCLTLFSGRGAAAAFAGACRLARALSEHDFADAVRLYERETRPIIADIMPATRNAVRWYVPRTAANHMIRDGLMRLVPNRMFRQYFKMKYSKV